MQTWLKSQVNGAEWRPLPIHAHLEWNLWI